MFQARSVESLVGMDKRKSSAELRVYEAAHRTYVEASGTLTTHAVKGTRPTEGEVAAERDARRRLIVARRAYWDGLAKAK
jgi:hypothetical protein